MQARSHKVSPRLSVESKALLHYIDQQRAPVDFDSLQAALQKDVALKKRLGNLCSTGWLQKNTSSGTVTWKLIRSIRMLGESTPMGDRATPRCIDVMHTEYKPKPSTPTRPGAMDYLAINSRGLRC